MPATNQPIQWTPQITEVPQNEQQRMAYIRGLMRDGRTAEAQAELQDLLRQDPGNTRLMITLAISYVRDNQLEDAAGCLEEIMRIDPKNRIAPLMAANVGMRGGNAEYSETHFQKALEINPTSIPALTGLATLHEQQKRPNDAVTVLSNAIGMNPQSARVRCQMARLLAGLDRETEALEHLEFAIEANPGDVRTTLQLARLLSKRGKTDEAIRTVQSALADKEDNRSLLQVLGTLKMAAGDHAGAETAFAKVLEKQERRNRNDNVHIAMARALIPQGKLSAARTELAKVRRQNMLPLVQRLYGDAYAAEDRLADAENSYRSALYHMPEGEQALGRIEAAKARLSAPGKDNVVALYDAEFKTILEAWQTRMRRRADQGMSPDQRQAMAERRQARTRRRQQAMRRTGMARMGRQGNQGGGFGHNPA